MNPAESMPIMTDWKERFIEAYDIEFCRWVQSIEEGKLTGAHQHHLRIIIALIGTGRLPHPDTLGVLILVPQQPPADIQLMDRHIGNAASTKACPCPLHNR